MNQRTPTPESGTPYRIAPHYRLSEPLENQLSDARALLALIGDLANAAPDGRRADIGTDELAAVVRVIHALLPDPRQMDYVPQQFTEVLQ